LALEIYFTGTLTKKKGERKTGQPPPESFDVGDPFPSSIVSEIYPHARWDWCSLVTGVQPWQLLEKPKQ